MSFYDEIDDVSFFEDDRYEDDLMAWENEQVFQDGVAERYDEDRRASMTEEEIEEEIAEAERRDEDAEWRRGCGV